MISQGAIWARIRAAAPGVERDIAVHGAIGVYLQQAVTQLRYALDVAEAGTVDAGMLTDITELEGLLRAVLDVALSPDPTPLRDWERCSCGGQLVADVLELGMVPLTETCAACGRTYDSIPF